ncbi:MAG TPA: putative toxin-antitoxin system toxin component, PIN family, partial [bacterium]|nr:putative toxin-antitoxin system toxin component, PIN family [bacterium]
LGQSESDISEVLSILAEEATKVIPRKLDKPVCEDPSDDPILGTALAGMADFLVSGDKDLLSLKRYEQIRIVSPREYWAKIMESGS